MKTMVSGFKAGFIMLLLGAFMAGCSGGGGGGSSSSDSGSTTTTAAETATGYFIDSAVQGLSYTSGGQSGTTGSDGKFTYETGKAVKFFIGNIVFGEATAKGYMTPVDLVSNGSVSNTTVLNIARFLMSLDSDNDTTNGITISDATRTAAQSASSIDFSTATDATLTTVLAQLNISVTLVTSTDAQSHLTGSIYGLYAWTYSGTWTDSGGYNGTWTITIDSNGAATSGSANGLTTGTTTLSSGQVSTNGAITFAFANGGSFSGTIDAATGAFSATCANSECQGVTFTGTKQTTTTPTASDFAGTWKGDMALVRTDGKNETTTITLAFALSNGSLTGTFSDSSNTSSITGAISVTNGTLSFTVPNTTPTNSDCANWNVAATATLDSTLKNMNTTMSGTFCSANGGVTGTATGTLTKQ